MMQAPEPTGGGRPLNVQKAALLPAETEEQAPWLIEELWAKEAVGIIGGPPKCCKTFLALEIALAVASGGPCLGRFKVLESGPVLLYGAEDSPAQIRARLLGLARSRGVDFQELPLLLILERQLRLDILEDKDRLAQAIEKHQPRLLILDPFVRLHRLDENSAAEVSSLLADLRVLQRRFHLAVILVHHTRKSNTEASGQALRGSSDFHAWGDSNLYLHKSRDQIRLTVEHRAARAPQPFFLELTGDAHPHLEVVPCRPEPDPPELESQVLGVLGRHPGPLTQYQLRLALKVRNQSLSEVLRDLLAQNKISRINGNWSLPG